MGLSSRNRKYYEENIFYFWSITIKNSILKTKIHMTFKMFHVVLYFPIKFYLIFSLNVAVWTTTQTGMEYSATTICRFPVVLERAELSAHFIATAFKVQVRIQLKHPQSSQLHPPHRLPQHLIQRLQRMVLF